MRIIRFYRKNFPAKVHFFPIFEKQASFAVGAANCLLQMMKTSNHDEWRRLEKEVKLFEVQGDALLAEFYEESYENLISAVNRDDLQTIAMDMDEFLDNINTSAKSILLYLPERIDAPIVDIAQCVLSEAEALSEAVTYMKEIKKTFHALALTCDRIMEFEHEADSSYEEYIGYIFREEKNAVELLKFKNIAEVLEATTDSAKKVSDHIRKLLLRYI